MPKYYVTSGNLRTMLEGDSSKDAVVKALKILCEKGHIRGLAFIVKVSEKGFETLNDDDVIFWTNLIANEMGDEGDEQSPGKDGFLL